MAKSKLVANQDKVIIRLPDGMRERIKGSAALRGKSMNDVIVQILEREFPPPLTLPEKIGQLLDLVYALRPGAKYEVVDHLVEELRKTMDAIRDGRLEIDDEKVRNEIIWRFEKFEEEEVKEEWARYGAALDIDDDLAE